MASLISLFLILSFGFSVKAESSGFIEIPAKKVKFIDRSTQQPLKLKDFWFYNELKYNCTTPDCQQFAGSHSSKGEVPIRGDVIQTPFTKVPQLEKSGTLLIKIGVPGVCRGAPECSVSMTLDEFLKAPEPITLTFDYDAKASAIENRKREEKTKAYFAELEKQMGASPPKESKDFDWTRLSAEYQENRKKLNPMVYSETAISKLGLDSGICAQDLKAKIEKCEPHACIYPVNLYGMKVFSDFIIHGPNRAGNCSISSPNAKRYFVPTKDLPYFHDAFEASLHIDPLSGGASISMDLNKASKAKENVRFQETNCLIHKEFKNVLDESNLLLATRKNKAKFPGHSEIKVSGKKYISKDSQVPQLNFKAVVLSAKIDKGSPAICKQKKVDLLYQLELRKLSADLAPLKIGLSAASL